MNYEMTRVNDPADEFPESEVDMAIWPCIMTACYPCIYPLCFSKLMRYLFDIA